MIVGVIIDAAAGILCVTLGLLIWKKQKISLLHDYHYKNVKKEDVPAYTRLMGIGLILIGSGICITGLLDLIGSRFWWVSIIAGITAGLIVFNKAQKKYNGSWL